MSAAAGDSTHPYVPPSPDASRSPCPGLNALANHGYLPHDGRNLTLTQLVSAIRQVYALSWPLATLLAFTGLVMCGRWQGLRRVLDLHDLAKHGVIEHDASLVHDDAAPGEVYAPTRVDRTLLGKLLDASSEPAAAGLSLRDLCAVQVARQRASHRLTSWKESKLSKGEIGFIHNVFGVPDSGGGDRGGAGDRVVPKTVLELWLGEERLPDGWRGPSSETTLSGMSSLIGKIERFENDLWKTETSEVPDSKEVVG